MCYIIVYANGDWEKDEEAFSFYSYCPSSIEMIIEYDDFGQITNAFNPKKN